MANVGNYSITITIHGCYGFWTCISLYDMFAWPYPFLEHSCPCFWTFTIQHPACVQVQLRVDHIFSHACLYVTFLTSTFTNPWIKMQKYENSIMFVMVHFCKTSYKHAFINNAPSCWNVLHISGSGLGIQGLYNLYFTTFAVTPRRTIHTHTYIYCTSLEYLEYRFFLTIPKSEWDQKTNKSTAPNLNFEQHFLLRVNFPRPFCWMATFSGSSNVWSKHQWLFLVPLIGGR